MTPWAIFLNSSESGIKKLSTQFGQFVIVLILRCMVMGKCTALCLFRTTWDSCNLHQIMLKSGWGCFTEWSNWIKHRICYSSFFRDLYFYVCYVTYQTAYKMQQWKNTYRLVTNIGYCDNFDHVPRQSQYLTHTVIISTYLTRHGSDSDDGEVTDESQVPVAAVVAGHGVLSVERDSPSSSCSNRRCTTKLPRPSSRRLANSN